MDTIRDGILARAEDDRPAIFFEDQTWSYRDFVQGCLDRAALFEERRGTGPCHVGVLLDNVPEYLLLAGAAALSGATLVGLNPTRRGRELERDVRHTDCQFLLTESRHAPALAGLDLGVDEARRFQIDSDAWTGAVAAHAGAGVPERSIDLTAPYLLIFTSGTTGDPKAAICSQGRVAFAGTMLGTMQELGPEDVGYCVMPLFHSNAHMAGWSPLLSVGGAVALRRKFSASGFLPDVRRYGVTYFNYVGKPLTYVLATEPAADDADNTLRVAFGNEAAEHDIARFAERFGCRVQDAYGSTEGGVAISRTPDTPAGSLGVGGPGTVILDPETGEECPAAAFDEHGKLTNADTAIGEIANTQAASSFEGYWNNAEANQERTRDDIYWTGDLGYRDENGFLYFAGRNFDWLRVDGENFAAIPVENVLLRHPRVSLAAVYAVPNPDVGDDCMAALILREGNDLNGAEMVSFLRGQADFGTKWMPRYIRVAASLPSTETNKILKRVLRTERWECDDPVWLLDGDTYRPITPQDVTEIRAAFEARGRAGQLDSGS